MSYNDLAVFDDVMHPHAPYGEDGARAWYRELLRRLKENPSLRVHYNPKTEMMERYEGYQWHEETVALYREFISHPHVRCYSSELRPDIVWFPAEAVLALAYTTAGAEAILSGKNTYFVDPLNCYPNTYWAHHPKPERRDFDGDYIKTLIEPIAIRRYATDFGQRGPQTRQADWLPSDIQKLWVWDKPRWSWFYRIWMARPACFMCYNHFGRWAFVHWCWLWLLGIAYRPYTHTLNTWDFYKPLTPRIKRRIDKQFQLFVFGKTR